MLRRLLNQCLLILKSWPSPKMSMNWGLVKSEVTNTNIFRAGKGDKNNLNKPLIKNTQEVVRFVVN